MRHIRIELLEIQNEEWPPEEWKKLAREAEQTLKSLPSGQSRADVFKRYSEVWGKLKEDFRQLSHEKCWYCEAKTDRMRGDIDHFRPKGRVTKIDHPGYWWLAFEWRNFRFACSVCNSGSLDPLSDQSGGKGNHFPLVGGESRRVCGPCAYEDHKHEYPLLLDPINPADPDLITFTCDGKPHPSAKRPAENEQPSTEYLRAQESIRIYQLDHSRSNRKRKIDIYHPLRNLVEKIQRDKLALAEDVMNTALREKIEDNILALRKMIAPDAEYSSAANAFLRKYRRWSWVDRISTGSK